MLSTPALVLGTFNAEAHWRPPEFATLPALKDGRTDRVVAAMDELLFSFAQPGDTLLTRRRMSPSFRRYLENLSIRFDTIAIESVAGDLKHDINSAPTCELLAEAYARRGDRGMLEGLSDCILYAVLPDSERAIQSCGITAAQPPAAAVCEVNSKAYSTRLSNNLLGTAVGALVDSSADLLRAGIEMLHQSPVVLKDHYGVSGGGNLRISTRRQLQRVVHHFAKQERSGKECHLVVEPLLQPAVDFSCHLDVTPASCTIVCIQTMRNSRLGGYLGSESDRGRLWHRLEAVGYFAFIESVAAEIGREGYLGPVCVDSMVLGDGTIVPIVEINARYSLGRINHQLLNRLTEMGIQETSVWSCGLHGDGRTRFSEVLEALSDANVLYNSGASFGILPLASRTLPEPTEGDGHEAAGAPGRFFYATVGQGADGVAAHAIVRQVLRSIGLQMRPREYDAVNNMHASAVPDAAATGQEHSAAPLRLLSPKRSLI